MITTNAGLVSNALICFAQYGDLQAQVSPSVKAAQVLDVPAARCKRGGCIKNAWTVSAVVAFFQSVPVSLSCIDWSWPSPGLCEVGACGLRLCVCSCSSRASIALSAPRMGRSTKSTVVWRRPSWRPPRRERPSGVRDASQRHPNSTG